MASQHAAVARATKSALPDARHIAVAQETGYAPHEVLSRGIAFCRANPREPSPDIDFDQEADRRFEEVVAAGWDAVDAVQEEERRVADAFRVLDAEGLTRRLTEARADAARVVAGRPLAFTIRTDPAEGGFAVVARLNGQELFRTPVWDEARALSEEPLLRAALFAYAAELGRQVA